MKQPLTTFNKAIGFISSSIEQVSGMTKPQKSAAADELAF